MPHAGFGFGRSVNAVSGFGRGLSRTVIVLVLAAGALIAAQQPASKQVEWPYYGGDPGGTKYSALTDIDATNVQRLQVAWEWKHWETVARRVPHDAGVFRGDAADDRRGALCDHPVQQHRGARRRDRPRTVAVRWRGLQAGPDPLQQRMETARHGFLARRQQASRLPEQPAPDVLARGRGRPAGSLVRRRGRRVADRRPGPDLGHQARDPELAAGCLPRPGDCREPGSRPRAGGRSSRIRAGIQRPHRKARVDVLPSRLNRPRTPGPTRG